MFGHGEPQAPRSHARARRDHSPGPQTGPPDLNVKGRRSAQPAKMTSGVRTPRIKRSSVSHPLNWACSGIAEGQAASPFETTLGEHLKHRIDASRLSRLPSMTKIVPGKASGLLVNTLAPHCGQKLRSRPLPDWAM